VTSAFIIQVQPQLQPDTGEETTTLLRVLIHKIDNTTFGGDAPAFPQWSGPPRAIIQVQAILYASLAASLFSAFLAMLGKQWLNRYASADMRGSAVERSRNRQRKLDGIVAWYFDYMMEALPLMLQLALLLLGCALSRYLWEIDTTIASVVLGVTVFGITFYTFIVIVGAASANCPYQTPGAHILRHIPPLVLGALYSATPDSRSIRLLVVWWDRPKGFGCSIGDVAELITITLRFPIFLAIDAYLLARAMIRVFVAAVCRVYGWFRGARGLDPQTTRLDLRCMTWMLQTSLDKTIHLLTLRSLATMSIPDDFDPALVSASFDVLAGCVSIVGGKVVVTLGSEELAVASVLCCLRTLSHPTIIAPASRGFKDMQQRYTGTFPIEANFEDLPSYHRFCVIHNIFYPSRKLSKSQLRYLRRPKVYWEGCEMSSIEHTILIQFARFEYERNQHRKVPRWILHFAHHLLSQDPPPPASVTVDYLSVIAIDLGCSVLNATGPDERYVRI